MEAISLLGVTVGITEVLKQAFGAKAAGAQLIGLLVGIVVTILSYAATALPAPWGPVVLTLLQGLVLGLTAVGLYAAADRFAAKFA